MYEFKNLTILTYKMEASNFEAFCESGRQNSYLLLLFHTKIRLSYNGKDYFPTGKNSVILYRPYQLQAYRSNDTDFLNSFLAFLVDENYFKRFSFPLGTVFTVDETYIEKLLKKMDRVSFLLNTHYEEHNRKNVPAMLDEIFCILDEAYQKSHNKVPNAENNLMIFSEIREEMKKSPVENSVQKMVNRSGYTATYFGICYKKYFNVSPSYDRQQQLVRVIKAYLENTNYSLEKIAELCKLQSVSYLITLFKKHENMTPHQYRLSIQKNDKNRK